MIRFQRTVLTLSVLIVSPPIWPGMARSQSRSSAEAADEMCMISGSAGLPGVAMQGLPGEAITDDNGVYSVDVTKGWSGTVTPQRPGVNFEPPSRTYRSLASNRTNDDYRGQPVTYTISGSTGVSGVVMQGLPGTPVTDASSRYSAEVMHGWSGAVVPSKRGFTFEPPSRTYAQVVAHVPHQDFTPKESMVVISDRIVVGGEPIEDVEVRAEPGGYRAVTDSRGRYGIKVPYGWSGQLIYSKPGFQFEPKGLRFDSVTSDIMDGRRAEETTQSPRAPRSQRWPGYRPAIVRGPLEEVLIVPSAELVPEVAAETAEDMQVMLHILREKLSEPRMIMGVWTDYGDFFGGDGREAFYLQGYGALFVMQIDFPLSFASPQPEAAEPGRETVDPVWQRARQRLHSPRGVRRPHLYGHSSQTDRASFEQFKEDLLRSLKHAANIRHLDPNEKVILTIIGQGQGALPGSEFSGGGSFSGGGGGTWGFEGGSWSYSGGSFGYGGGSSYGDSGAYSRGTGRSGYGSRRSATGAPGATAVLTVQARKADVDAFAAGELDFDAFCQRVKIFTY
jgi:hypothetical protein